MKKLCILILLISNCTFGQMLDNRSGNAFTDKPFFNKEFIRNNKVKFLNGQFTYKKPGEVMRSTQYRYVYEFDSTGKLSSSFETRKDDNSQDTSWNVYIYNTDDFLLEHKKGDGKGFTSTTFEYDQKNRIIKESNVREYIDSLGIQQRTILNTESMTYEEYDKQTKKTIFNSYGLPYMHEFTYYNDLGYLIERVERLTTTLSVTSYKYEYSEKGYIAAIKAYQLGNDKPYEENLFFYDEHGNLLEKHIYRDGIFDTEIELIYNEKSKLLSYVLTHDVKTNFIMILGFKDYVFF